MNSESTDNMDVDNNAGVKFDQFRPDIPLKKSSKEIEPLLTKEGLPYIIDYAARQ